MVLAGVAYSSYSICTQWLKYTGDRTFCCITSDPKQQGHWGLCDTVIWDDTEDWTVWPYTCKAGTFTTKLSLNFNSFWCNSKWDVGGGLSKQCSKESRGHSQHNSAWLCKWYDLVLVPSEQHSPDLLVLGPTRATFGSAWECQESNFGLHAYQSYDLVLWAAPCPINNISLLVHYI